MSGGRLFRAFGRKTEKEGAIAYFLGGRRCAKEAVITKNLAFINISGFFFACILGRVSEKIIFVWDLLKKLKKHLLTLKFIPL